MNIKFKKYQLLLLVSLLVVTLYSCKKGGEPVPSFDQSELNISDDVVIVNDVDPGDKDGGDKGGGDIVGGDDNEDDDGGVFIGHGSDSDGDIKGGNGDGVIDPKDISGADSKAG